MICLERNQRMTQGNMVLVCYRIVTGLLGVFAVDMQAISVIYFSGFYPLHVLLVLFRVVVVPVGGWKTREWHVSISAIGEERPKKKRMWISFGGKHMSNQDDDDCAAICFVETSHVHRHKWNTHTHNFGANNVGREKKTICHTCRPRMLLRPMVSVTDFGCYGITEEMERSLYTWPHWKVNETDDKLGAIDCEPIVDKLHIRSDSSSSSSDSSSASEKDRKRAEKRYSRMENTSSVVKKERRKSTKRRARAVSSYLDNYSSHTMETRKPLESIYNESKALSTSTLCDSHTSCLELGVCRGKRCSKNIHWEMVHQIISQQEEQKNVQVKSMQCSKLCSNKGFTVTIQGTAFGNMNADTLYQVLSDWDSEVSHETVVRHAA